MSRLLDVIHESLDLSCDDSKLNKRLNCITMKLCFRMFHAPAYWHDNSLKISSVLEDIGVNERMVLKRRRRWLVGETMRTITSKLTGYDFPKFYFGSQSEGTTTLGLNSDIDLVHSMNTYNVIQMWEEWKPGANNLMMIQDKNTTPGYCFLQQLCSDVPLPLTVNEAQYKDHAIYKRDKVILKNTMFNSFKPEEQTREGAAFTLSLTGYTDRDTVFAFPCKSFTRPVRAWLYKQEQTGNISNPIKRFIESNPCLVVQTGCKGSQFEEYEWRISTSFIERCLMLNLNITQIQCYVMMKLVLKTYLNNPNGKLLSSFVCKNILLFSIKCISPAVWKPRNLLHVFTFCLLKLKQCVLSGECPHFIIHENNLLRRKLNSESKAWLIDRIDIVIQSHGCAFLGIKLDDIESRLMSKLNIIHETRTIVDTPEIVSLAISGTLIINTATEMSDCNTLILRAVMSGKSDLFNILRILAVIYSRGCKLDQKACRLLTPLLCSTLGCIKASEDILRGIEVSFEAMAWLSVGLNSDVASSGLKLASVIYCVGDMNRVETILRQTEEQYQLDMVAALCMCYGVPGERTVSQQFIEFAANRDEDAVQHIIAFCVRFLPSEINCIPHELRYEMFRSTSGDMPHRRKRDFWMDWAVIDALPYLYFLQYKTYGRLHRYDDQLQALTNFAYSIFTTRKLGHRESALNLLGQCMEQEDRPQHALQCYMMSLRERPKNNVAKIHICRLLCTLLRT